MQLARHFGLPLLAAPVERPDAPASGRTCRGCWPERTANARTAAADPRSCFPTGAHDQHRNSAPACDSWRPLGATHEPATSVVVQCLIRSRHWFHSYDPGPGPRIRRCAAEREGVPDDSLSCGRARERTPDSPGSRRL